MFVAENHILAKIEATEEEKFILGENEKRKNNL